MTKRLQVQTFQQQQPSHATCAPAGPGDLPVELLEVIIRCNMAHNEHDCETDAKRTTARDVLALFSVDKRTQAAARRCQLFDFLLMDVVSRGYPGNALSNAVLYGFPSWMVFRAAYHIGRRPLSSYEVEKIVETVSDAAVHRSDHRLLRDCMETDFVLFPEHAEAVESLFGKGVINRGKADEIQGRIKTRPVLATLVSRRGRVGFTCHTFDAKRPEAVHCISLLLQCLEQCERRKPEMPEFVIEFTRIAGHIAVAKLLEFLYPDHLWRRRLFALAMCARAYTAKLNRKCYSLWESNRTFTTSSALIALGHQLRDLHKLDPTTSQHEERWVRYVTNQFDVHDTGYVRAAADDISRCIQKCVSTSNLDDTTHLQEWPALLEWATKCPAAFGLLDDELQVQLFGVTIYKAEKTLSREDGRRLLSTVANLLPPPLVSLGCDRPGCNGAPVALKALTWFLDTYAFVPSKVLPEDVFDAAGCTSDAVRAYMDTSTCDAEDKDRDNIGIEKENGTSLMKTAVLKELFRTDHIYLSYPFSEQQSHNEERYFQHLLSELCTRKLIDRDDKDNVPWQLAVKEMGSTTQPRFVRSVLRALFPESERKPMPHIRILSVGKRYTNAYMQAVTEDLVPDPSWDVDSTDACGNTIFHAVALHFEPSYVGANVLRSLIDAVNARLKNRAAFLMRRNRSGDTPLMLFVKGHLYTCLYNKETLYADAMNLFSPASHKKDDEHADFQGRTPLMVASHCSGLVRALLCAGIVP